VSAIIAERIFLFHKRVSGVHDQEQGSFVASIVSMKPAELATKKAWKNFGKISSLSDRATFRSYIRASLQLHERLGTHFFVAVSKPSDIRLFHDAYLMERAQ